MSRFVNGDAVIVGVGECQCPGSPHSDGDVVKLRPRLTLAGGLAAIAALQMSEGEERTVALGKSFLQGGICGWNFEDENGPVPVTPERIADLDWGSTGYTLADRAADLYGASILGPLVVPGLNSSPSGQTGSSTSARKSGSGKRPRR